MILLSLFHSYLKWRPAKLALHVQVEWKVLIFAIIMSSVKGSKKLPAGAKIMGKRKKLEAEKEQIFEVCTVWN